MVLAVVTTFRDGGRGNGGDDGSSSAGADDYNK